MIYLQMGILILEIGLCILLNNLLKNKSNKNTIHHLDNDQEIHLNNITLIGRKDYTNKNQRKQKTTILQIKPTTLSQTINHKEQEKTLKIMSTSTQWSHPQRSNVSLSFSYHLQPNFADNYGKETFKPTQKSLAQALLVGVFL